MISIENCWYEEPCNNSKLDEYFLEIISWKGVEFLGIKSDEKC